MAKEKDTTGISEEGKVQRLKRLRIGKKLWVTLLIVLLVLLASFFSYQYVKTRNELTKTKNPESAAKTEAQDLAKDLNKYLDLPDNETPTLATVSDKEKLKDQPFFRRAENGDKILVYVKSQRAILYRPSTKKIIEYAPVNLSN